MRKVWKRVVLIGAIILCAILILAFGKYVISGFGTGGLEFKSNGDGTCYVSGVRRTSVTNLRIPTVSPTGERVTGIGKSAFEGCPRLRTIRLHDNIVSIGADAFYNCDDLVYTKYDNAYYIGNNANPYEILAKPVSSSIESCEIHPDTEIINSAAFAGCEKLYSISIPEGVRGIGAYAFAWCTGLLELELPESVKHIGEYAFLDCIRLERIAIPDACEVIGNWSFAFCKRLSVIEFSNDSRVESIGDYAFYSCIYLERFDFDRLQDLRRVGYAAFAGCSALRTVTAPVGTVKFGDAAFRGCVIEGIDEVMSRAEKPKNTLYAWDVPENMGVLNTLIKAKQLKNISFTAEATVPRKAGDIAAHKNHVGMIYSSSRIDNLFVPNFVSLYSFMSSTKNPHSYLNTVDLGELGNENGDTYYGAVCSTFCSYALGLRGLYTTHQWRDVPNMDIVEEGTIDYLALGDTVVGKGHVLLVTGIERDARGNVHRITLTDIAVGGVAERTHTRDAFETEYSIEDYTYCRYSRIGDSKFETTPLVIVCDKTPKSFRYNDELMPRKGDRSNWLLGQDVELDVLNAKDYQKIEIYLGDKLIETRSMSDVVVLRGLKAGSYKARLVGAYGASEFCYWIVADAESFVTSSALERHVDVKFSSKNAKPLFIVWQNADNNGAVHIQFLTPAQVEQGFAQARYKSGKYKVRVAFETEYGIIFSELPEEIAVR